jgi:IMP and pyridine-specific 5'-nucleotidase
MSNDTKIGIVTAAGYTEAEKYHGRLHGLLTAVNESAFLTERQKKNLIIMGLCLFLLYKLEKRASPNRTIMN